MLMRVQKKFLKYANHLLKIDCPPHDYSPVLNHFNIDTLSDHRQIANHNFIYIIFIYINK